MNMPDKWMKRTCRTAGTTPNAASESALLRPGRLGRVSTTSAIDVGLLGVNLRFCDMVVVSYVGIVPEHTQGHNAP